MNLKIRCRTTQIQFGTNVSLKEHPTWTAHCSNMECIRILFLVQNCGVKVWTYPRMFWVAMFFVLNSILGIPSVSERATAVKHSVRNFSTSISTSTCGQTPTLSMIRASSMLRSQRIGKGQKHTHTTQNTEADTGHFKGFCDSFFLCELPSHNVIASKWHFQRCFVMGWFGAGVGRCWSKHSAARPRWRMSGLPAGCEILGVGASVCAWTPVLLEMWDIVALSWFLRLLLWSIWHFKTLHRKNMSMCKLAWLTPTGRQNQRWVRIQVMLEELGYGQGNILGVVYMKMRGDVLNSWVWMAVIYLPLPPRVSKLD